MRHPSPPDDRFVKPPSLPRPPPSWRSAVGICSPSSGTEVVYDSPEAYGEDDVPAPSPSPETKKRRDAEFEKDLAEITSESDEYDPTGKTPEQLPVDAMIAMYHRDVKTSRMESNRRSMLLEGINAACPVCHVHVSSDCCRYTEASRAEQRDAVQRRQMERARDRTVEGTGRSCPLPHLCSYRICAAFAAADPAEDVPGRYLHYYYYDSDDIVCSTGTSSEREPDPLDPPVGPNEEDWVSRYNEHVRRRAAGEVGPIKTIPKPRTTPILPAGPIPALDTKLLVTSKVLI